MWYALALEMKPGRHDARKCVIVKTKSVQYCSAQVMWGALLVVYCTVTKVGRYCTVLEAC